MASKIGKIPYSQLYTIFFFLVIIGLGWFAMQSESYNNLAWYSKVAYFLIIKVVLLWQFLSTQKVLQKIQLLKENQDQIFHQVESSQQLFHFINPKLPIPSTRNWVASPDFILALFDILLQKKSASIVELGSGVSTLYLAYLMEQHEIDGVITSYDHDPVYAEKTRSLLARHGLANRAKIIDSPLDEKGWYQIPQNSIPKTISLLIVDGPPTVTHSNARNQAFPFFKPYFKKGSLLVADDCKREEGQRMMREWQESQDLILKDYLYTEKGTGIFEVL